MNSLVYFAICCVILWAGYRFYGKAFERFLGIDGARKTPAHTRHDGVDYVPAKYWLVLFGHHFSSIAGAGPIIGPVIAVTFWGWGPATLFVLIGSIFIGGIHDFGALFLSIKYDGSSVSDISEKILSRTARRIFSWFVLLALIVVVAVFVYFCSQTFIVEPKIVVPSLGLIPVAVIVGLMMYRWRVKLAISTVFGIAAMIALIFAGQHLPVLAPKGFEMAFWTAVLLGYCALASILPVNILLQPRDYIAGYMLIFGIAAGAAGIITARPDFATPYYISWNTKEGCLWPMLFVTIACGAVSGFHALVATGTTSKQIASETDARRIGYGAMIVEAVVAVIAIVAMAAGFKNLEVLKSVVNKVGPVNAYGDGFAYVTRFILGPYGSFIAVITLNAFILTTLDTATRIGRYIAQEIFKGMDRYTATSIIIVASGWLALSGSWQKIWPIFGSANQLIAALTLLVLSSWFLLQKKHVRFTLIPAIFMLVTTLVSLSMQLLTYIKSRDIFLASVDVILMALAFAMVTDVYLCVKKIIMNSRTRQAI
jgi:carbon starvation protein